jgi:hypothetical protein
MRHAGGAASNGADGIGADTLKADGCILAA